MFSRIAFVVIMGALAIGCGDSKRRNAPIVSGGGLTVTSSNLVNATVGQSLNTQLTANGGVAPLGSWSVIAGALPSGLGLTPNGLLAGTPTAAGNSTVTIRVLDSNSPPASAQQTLTLNVSNDPSTPSFATKNGMTSLSFADSGLLGNGVPVNAGAAGQSFTVIALMGTSSTVRAGERYWVQLAYNVGSMPDGRFSFTPGVPVSGSGSGVSVPFPLNPVVAGNGTFEIYMQVSSITDINNNPSTARSLSVTLSPNSGGGSAVLRTLTLN